MTTPPPPDPRSLSDREIAALVAERVMRWSVVRVPTIEGGLDEWWSEQTYPLFAIHPEGGQWLMESLYNIESKAFQPSTEIACAFQVVEKMREQGWRVEMDSDEEGWGVSILKGVNKEGYADAESLPRAICLASLKATGE